MTDLPRKAYPLVVAPPGGFEDAVRRGRRRRRQHAGGSTGAALALVGVLAYALTGGTDTGGDRLDPTRQPKTDQTAPAGPIGGDPMTTPEATASPGGRGGKTPAPGGGHVVAGPSARPGPGGGGAPSTDRPSAPPVQQPPRDPKPGMRYAPRDDVTRDPAMANAEPDCLPKQGDDWCTVARVDPFTEDQVYTLEFVVCRALRAGDGALTFERKPQADFKTIEDATKDTVWTHSLGARVQAVRETVTIAGGQCVTWHTDWNGLDDYGRLPAKGTYRLVARSFATTPLPPAEFVFEVE